jgi:hypothetical protein
MRSAATLYSHEAGRKSGPEIHCNEQKAYFSAIRQLKKERPSGAPACLPAQMAAGATNVGFTP